MRSPPHCQRGLVVLLKIRNWLGAGKSLFVFISSRAPDSFGRPRVQQRRTSLFSFGLFGSFGFLFKPKPVLNSKHAAGHSEALAEEPASRHCKRVAENSSFRREVPDEVDDPDPFSVALLEAFKRSAIEAAAMFHASWKKSLNH